MADNSKGSGGTGARVLYWVFSLGVTVGIFTYLLRNVSLGDVWDLIKGINKAGVACFLVLSFAMSFFRLWRYKVMLRLWGYAPPSVALFLVVLVRNFFSDLLPARLGTLVYIYLVNTRLGVPFEAAAASFSLAFIFDMIAIAPLILAAVLAAGLGTGLPPGALLVGAGGLCAVSVAVLYALPFLFRISGTIGRKLKLFGQTRTERLVARLEGVGREIDAARKQGVYGRLLLLSVLVRVGKYASLYVLLYALLAPMGYGLRDLPVSKVFLGMCAAEVAASTPISGIAGFGVYEGTWSLVFRLLGFPEEMANLTSISHHLFTQVYGYGLGALALLALLLPFFKVTDARKAELFPGPGPFRFYGAVASAIAAFALLIAGISVLGAGSERWQRAACHADVPSRDEEDARREFDAVFPGRVLFDSNRSGTFGIFSMCADGSDVRPIADSHLHEMYPDPSPDGRLIVFARTAVLSKKAPAEIWICDRNGGNSRKLADNGTFPTFSGDGRLVYFERERRKLMAVNVDGSREREIFPTTSEDWGDYQIVKPRVTADGSKVVFISDRRGRWNLWWADLRSGKAFHVSDGCEGGWFCDGRRIVWIKDKGVRERTGIFEYDLQDGRISEIHDGDAPRGHEYFPTLAAEDAFLLWSACRPGEHDHLAAGSNYQIYGKRLPDGKAVRITFDAFNNRWPKLLKDVPPGSSGSSTP